MEDEIRTFSVILLLPGYYKVLYQYLYWENAPETHNEAVLCAISRNRFRQILSNLYPADKTQITEDRQYKVWELTKKLNFNFKQYGSCGNYSVDERIIPYYGKHVTKQFIRGESIRYGFKLWCITSSERYQPHAEPYCGVDNNFPDTGLGQGTDVVLGLIEKCNVKDGSAVRLDNLFTLLPLLDEVTKLGIGVLKTIRQNRFHGAPVANKTTLPKKPGRSYDFASDGKYLLASLLDKKVVTYATNYVTCNPASTAELWSKSAKKRVDVPMPKHFEDYNKQMGGVDLFD